MSGSSGLYRLLEDGLVQLRILSDEQVRAIMPKLEIYFNELQLWNPKLGLLQADAREIVVKHMLDSAAGLPVFLPRFSTAGPDQILRIADLGSGAGFPGLMLALLFEALGLEYWSMDLVDRQQRRCVFLENLLAVLRMGSRVRVLQTSFEDLSGGYQIVTSRAFRNLDAPQRELQKSLLLPGGCILAYKGRRTTLLAELGGELPEGSRVHSLPVPFLDEERCIFQMDR